MSMSRPDPASPERVADATFSTGRRGYHQDEVRDFLRMVSAELGRLHERERFLERELRSAHSNPDLDTAQFDDETLIRLVGEETFRVLAAARESANEIRMKAEQSAARILTEASDEASRRREEAEVEASRLRADAAKDAEAEIDLAKQQGREMVNEARAYRERVLTELSRRRDLAREQIDQLVEGRDRLTQAFERARLVAVDVVAELQPIGEPDEYVDLSPTTGPVPVMQARTDRAPIPAEPEEPEQIEEPTVLVEPEAERAPEPEKVEHSEEQADPIDEVELDEGEEVLVEPGAERALEPQQAEIETIDIGTTDHDASNDVVVDLFARIRSEASTDEQTNDDEPGDQSESDVVAEVASITVGETETDAAVETDDIDDAAGHLEATEFEQRDADLTPLIVAGAKKLKRVLADEQNQVLERLRRDDPVADVAGLLPDVDEHASHYVDAIYDDLLCAANAGAQLSSPGRTATLSKSQGSDAVERAAVMVEDWLISPLRDRLDRCISEGNGDNTVVTKKVRAAYREWKTQHIDEHLDDVMRAAHGSGVLDGFELGTPVRWTVDSRHGSCPDCDDNSLQGTVPAGDAFPTGHTFAPAHPGCRCLLVADAP